MKWSRVFVAGLFRLGLLAVFALPLSAQDDSYEDVDTGGLVVEASAGWDGVVEKQGPVPISFLLQNFNPDAIQGDLYLQEQFGRNQEVRLGEVFITPNGSRQFNSLQSLWDWQDCVATLRDGDRILWRRQLALNTGRSFFANTNYVLFVDESGRSLTLPSGPAALAANTSSDFHVASELGRPVECVTMKYWEVPKHCGAMCPAQAVVLSDEIDVKSLNRLQWKALADFVCQGGLLFMRSGLEKVREKILSESTLSISETVREENGLRARDLGLGTFYEYDNPLLSGDGAELRGAIESVVALTPKQHLGAFLRHSNNFADKQRQSQRSYGLIFVLFGLYTLLSGVVTLVLFRFGRRQIAIYTACIVAGACVFASVIGGLLRASNGDLNWSSVTQVRGDQAVQMAKIEVKSAGSRSQRIAVTGTRPDLQYSGVNRWNHYYDRSSYSAWRPFTWTANLEKEDLSRFDAQIPMNPFGQRFLQAVDYREGVPPLDIQIEFLEVATTPKEPDGRSERQRESYEVQATFKVRVKNNLQQPFRSCYLRIGTTAYAEKATASKNYYNSPPPSGLIDVYTRIELPKLEAGEEAEHEQTREFSYHRSRWDLQLDTGTGNITLPRIRQLGTSAAWFVGELSESPILQVDDKATDFVRQSGYHVLVQEVSSEDMPDLSRFFTDAEQGEEAEE